MVERRHLAPGSDPFRRPAAAANPSANIFSSMGIVVNKIQREELPKSKILPEAARQAPSMFPQQPDLPTRPLPRVKEEANRQKDPGTP